MLSLLMMQLVVFLCEWTTYRLREFEVVQQRVQGEEMRGRSLHQEVLSVKLHATVFDYMENVYLG